MSTLVSSRLANEPLTPTQNLHAEQSAKIDPGVRRISRFTSVTRSCYDSLRSGIQSFGIQKWVHVDENEPPGMSSEFSNERSVDPMEKKGLLKRKASDEAIASSDQISQSTDAPQNQMVHSISASRVKVRKRRKNVACEIFQDDCNFQIPNAITGSRWHQVVDPPKFIHSADLVISLHLLNKLSAKEKSEADICRSKFRDDANPMLAQRVSLELLLAGCQEDFLLIRAKHPWQYDGVLEAIKMLHVMIMAFVATKDYKRLYTHVKRAVQKWTDFRMIEENKEQLPSRLAHKLKVWCGNGCMEPVMAVFIAWKEYLTLNREKILQLLLKSSSQPPQALAQLVVSLAYQRIVGPSLSSLKKYKAFSSNVYGELEPALISQIFRQCKMNALGSNAIVVDMGCGIGNVVALAAIEFGARSYGIEQMSKPSELAKLLIDEARCRAEAMGIKCGAMQIDHGDFLLNPTCHAWLKQADVIICNNYAFSAELMVQIMNLFSILKIGAKIVTLKPFQPPKFVINNRTKDTFAARLKQTRYPFKAGSVSWSDMDGHFYIETIMS